MRRKEEGEEEGEEEEGEGERIPGLSRRRQGQMFFYITLL